jgi:hypothetical protein
VCCGSLSLYLFSLFFSSSLSFFLLIEPTVAALAAAAAAPPGVAAAAAAAEADRAAAAVDGPAVFKNLRREEQILQVTPYHDTSQLVTKSDHVTPRSFQNAEPATARGAIDQGRETSRNAAERHGDGASSKERREARTLPTVTELHRRILPRKRAAGRGSFRRESERGQKRRISPNLTRRRDTPSRVKQQHKSSRDRARRERRVTRRRARFSLRFSYSYVSASLNTALRLSLSASLSHSLPHVRCWHGGGAGAVLARRHHLARRPDRARMRTRGGAQGVLDE